MWLFSHILAHGAFTDLLRLEVPAADEIQSNLQQALYVIAVIYIRARAFSLSLSLPPNSLTPPQSSSREEADSNIHVFINQNEGLTWLWAGLH